ncbi:4'-phosphopantetheinyl transferase superfamily protein [Myxococcota bacterium]|nr:4'-phosphopantetheinyl transferase superfamily protein [Myxococcota bacterium]
MSDGLPHGPGAWLAWWSATSADLPASDAWLAPEERAILAGLRVPKRAADFVLGRYTAKRVVAAVISALERTTHAGDRSHTETVDALHAEPLGPPSAEALTRLATFAIVPRSDGSPEARQRGRALPLDVSLSHSAGRALAVVTLDPAERVGCDVEHVEPRGPELARDFFTAAERQALAGRSGDALDVATTLVWSAKESVLKVLREGLRADTRSVELALDPEQQPGHVWRAVATHHVPEGRIYATAAMCRGAFVFTVATSRTAPEVRLVELGARVS